MPLGTRGPNIGPGGAGSGRHAFDGGLRGRIANQALAVSRRQRGSRRVPDRTFGSVEPAARAGRSSPAPGPSLREQLEGASLAARALLPIRFFFGITFLYAGIDKILDPAFFDASAPSSIVAQMAAFARTSPLAPVIRISEPFAIPIGLLIALGEIAIGLGALTGLSFRLAAAGGAALSFLFFLTASWTTRPYYFGPDLPYAFGWLALAIAGDGGLLVPGFIRELGSAMDDALPWGVRVAGPATASGFRPPRYLDTEPSASRRALVRAGALGAVSLAVAAVALPVRVLRGGDDSAGTDGGGEGALSAGLTSGVGGGGAGATPVAALPGSSLAPGSSPVPGGPTSAPASSAGSGFKPSGLTVTTTAQVDQHGAVRIRVPTSAPSSLPAGDPALVVKLSGGGYACFDAICTHAGCRVGWDARDGVMLCPCHGAAFDPNHHGAVLQGPARQPLLELPISIDSTSGAITLKA
jgi:thiosulfate dehydrogenase [quinone] large subunit